MTIMKKTIVTLIALALLACALLPFSQAEPTIVLTSVSPERPDPLEEITLNLLISNTTDEDMWRPLVRIELTDTQESYFTLVEEEEVEVDLQGERYLSPNESASTALHIVPTSTCPAQKHQLSLIVRYRSGACEGGCQWEQYSSTITVQIFRQDPKLAFAVKESTGEVMPGDPIEVKLEMKNFGTGIARNIALSTESTPEIPLEEITYLSAFDPPELGVTGSAIAIARFDTTDVPPGYHTLFFTLSYEDKYGGVHEKTGSIEVKIKGTAVQEAFLQAEQLRELGENAYAVSDYTTAISYLERAIELYERLGYDELAQQSQARIQLAKTYLQAHNYYVQGDAQFAEGNYREAKKFYELSLDIYAQLGNSKKVTEVRNKVQSCEDELYKFDIMEGALYGAVGLCAVYGTWTKRRGILKRLKRE